MHVLVVEDDSQLADLLATQLRRQGYAVDTAHNTAEAEELLHTNAYNLAVLDWNLPDRAGVAFCADLRRRGIGIPILMMTGRGDESDRVRGLDAGADDYMVKPFSVAEFLARVRANLRRQPIQLYPHVSIGDIVIDTRRQEVFKGSRPVMLTAKEYRLLEYFARNLGRMISRTELSRHIWDDNHDPASHTIEVHISTLRKKLSLNRGNPTILGRRGSGYVLSPE